MKWETPQLGDWRERTIFAFFPIKCEDGYSRWLCKVRVREEYIQYGGSMNEAPNEGWCVQEAYPIGEPKKGGVDG